MIDLGQFLAEQPALAGAVGLGATGGLLWALRQVPAKLGLALREAATVSLVVDSDDEVYQHLGVWLVRARRAEKARRLMLVEAYDYERGVWDWGLTLGAGWHLQRFGGRWLVIHRHVQPPDALAKAVGGGRRERLTVMTLGGDQGPIRDLLAEAKEAYFGGGLVRVLHWCDDGYRVADNRRRRPLSTVFMPEGQKAGLVGDVRRFVGARDRYLARGVPWRRGYLLEGPPGTGKSTLIHVLAGEIDRSIYVVNLSNLMGDNELFRAVNAVGHDGVLVFEDIDGLRASHDRERQDAAVAASGGRVIPFAPPGEQAASSRGVTLSGLLNAIDGVTAREGRILFMTSNRPDALDPALLRPGRVGRRETIGPLGAAEARAMWRAFRPDGEEAEFQDLVAGRLPMTAAELQGLLLAGAEAGL